jgi:uncharacterized membrane protein YeaQ/YmgE (transglycosylase-associated protein family)
MVYKQDPLMYSLLWGRVGASIALLLSIVLQLFGLTFAHEDQQAFVDAVSGALVCIGTIQVIVSKIRESKRI